MRPTQTLIHHVRDAYHKKRAEPVIVIDEDEVGEQARDNSRHQTRLGKSKASRDGAGGRRDSGHQRNSPEKKRAEPVIVIDEDEVGEQARDNSRHQTRLGKSKASREPRKTSPYVSEGVVGGTPSAGASSYDYQQNEPNGGRRKTEPTRSSLSIPPLRELKDGQSSSVTKTSPLKLSKSQDARRSGGKEREREGTQTASRSVAAAPVYVSAGETPDSTGKCMSSFTQGVDIVHMQI
jgi:hypothetical protein